MTVQEDFIIQEPYSPTPEELHAIEELKTKGLVPNDWNSQKVGIKSFKDNIRNEMYYKQNCRCAYCRMELFSATHFLQREHIVHKNEHPQWMFEPRNLCVTCDWCNNYKKDEEVLFKPNVEDYPTASEDYKIVNPFLDTYSEHIKIEEDLIYVGKTNKGRFTINTCKLYRPELALERAKQKMKTENPESVMTQMLSLLSTNSFSINELNEVQRRAEQIVRMYKRGE